MIICAFKKVGLLKNSKFRNALCIAGVELQTDSEFSDHTVLITNQSINLKKFARTWRKIFF
jgi:hypothetical protein